MEVMLVGRMFDAQIAIPVSVIIRADMVVHVLAIVYMMQLKPRRAACHRLAVVRQRCLATA